MDGEKKQKKEISLEELFQRAEAADSSEKYNISSNYYFLILSRHISKIATDKNKYNSVLYKFIFDTIMCTNVTQKERLMNYLYQNDKLGVAELKPIFEKFINYQILYLDDLKSLMKQLPSTHKNINITKALFEHNIYSLSRVFKNISFNSLEKFLKMKMDDIMTLCVKMINQGSIKAKIDQNSKFLLFEQEQGVSTDFDEQIKNFCLKTKNLAEFINTN